MSKLVCIVKERMEQFKVMYLWQTFWKNRKFAIDTLLAKRDGDKIMMLTSDNVLDTDIVEFNKHVETFDTKLYEPQ